MEKQFLKTSDIISTAWHKFKTRLDKSLANMQLVEVVSILRELFVRRAFWILHVKIYSCRYL